MNKKEMPPLESLIAKYRVRLKLEKPRADMPITRLMVERPEIKGEWPLIRSPAEAYRILKCLEQEPRELLIGLYLDSHLRLAGIDEVAKGDSAEVRFKFYELFKASILLNASEIIIAHNHPGGNALPSPKDRAMNKKLIRASKIVDVRAIDNIVIGCGSYYSFAREGFKGMVPLNRRGQYRNGY